MGLTFREKLLIQSAVSTLLIAIEDEDVARAIAAPLVKVVAAGTVALRALGMDEALYEAAIKAGSKKPLYGAPDPPAKKK